MAQQSADIQNSSSTKPEQPTLPDDINYLVHIEGQKDKVAAALDAQSAIAENRARNANAGAAGNSAVAPAHASTSTSAPYFFQVTLNLDPEVYQYFSTLAEVDERPLSKYLSRVLRQVWMKDTTAPPDKDQEHLTR